MNAPNSGLITESELALFEDYYELTMGMADHALDNNVEITENYFVRKVPQGSYMVSTGLEQVVSFVKNIKFSEEDIKWLQDTSNGDLSDDFIGYLRNFQFKGDIYAVPEGTPVFPGEPIINISGPSIDVQLIETYLLNMMNFQTLIATKAARISETVKGKTLLDFGARRAHGRDAAMLGARASYIGGAVGTSLVAAGKKFGLPYVGTMAHKFVQDRPDELTAFRDYANVFPHNPILLIDTFDTVQGARNAAIVGKELAERGYQLKGVRLDSGDLLKLSREVRKILDEAGLTDVKVFASNDLDEFTIDRLLEEGAPIDGFGVGTRLITGAVYNPFTKEGGVAALPGVYKEVERREGSKVIPKMKLSSEMAKMTLPSKKQVYRRFDEQGMYAGDAITLWDENSDGKPLLIPIMEKGEIIYDFPSISEIREYSIKERAKIPAVYRDIHKSEKYAVRLSSNLSDLTDKLAAELR